MDTQRAAHSLTKNQSNRFLSLYTGQRVYNMPDFTPVSSEGMFHNFGRKTHKGIFQMRYMGIYGRFFLEQSAVMPFSASRGCQWRFRVGRDDVGDVCCQLKNLILRWMEGYKSPTTTSRGHIRFSCDSPSAHATHCGKIGTKMLFHSLGFSPHA